ncbi:MAG TPA: ABC transporter ATP-binding protein [Chloroflexota bacterium]|jgi:ABC-type Fe3+/spermidine/putrescine transport system ATPase subunit
MSGILEVRGLAKRYGGVRAVDDVSFDLAEGQVLTLLGPSGCGKSTTLRLVAGLEEPDGGEIRLHGRVVAAASPRVFVAAEKRNLGLVFQSYAVWPHMTVAQNVAYPLELRRVPRAQIRGRVEEVLRLVGLEGLADRPATALSGGQQQRVSLARAIVYEPDILLLDEPLSNLDAQLRQEMRVQLKALQARLGTTILYVTHDQIEAMALSHVVAVMRHGQIEQLGTPAEVYEAPASYFVHSFVGRLLAFDGIVRRDNGTAWIELDAASRLPLDAAAALAAGTHVRVALRPEDVEVAPLGVGGEPHGLVGTLDELVYCGGHFEAAVRLGESEVVLELPKQLGVARGQQVALRCAPGKVRTWPV